MKIFKIILRTFFIIIPFLLVAYFIFNVYFYVDCLNSVEYMPDYKIKNYMKVLVYGSTPGTDDTISAKISVLDSSGNEIAAIERSWPGLYLALEFNQLNMAGKSFLFPSKIYGKDRILENRNFGKTYVSLNRYYDENGICLLLGKDFSVSDKEALFKISRFTNHQYPIIELGFRESFTLDLSGCEPGKSYLICENAKGGIDIVEE